MELLERVFQLDLRHRPAKVDPCRAGGFRTHDGDASIGPHMLEHRENEVAGAMFGFIEDFDCIFECPHQGVQLNGGDNPQDLQGFSLDALVIFVIEVHGVSAP